MASKLASLIGLLALVSICRAADEEQMATLKVVSPQTLKESFQSPEDYALTVANFGDVPWGRTIIGNAYFAKPANGCTNIIPVRNGEEIKNNSFEETENPIIVVERGECTFVMKALLAQLAGAKMLIVVDNEDEDVRTTLPIDDGQGGALHIPTIMINKAPGQKLIESLSSSSDRVIISVSFSVPKDYTQVDYEIWLSSSDFVSFDVIKEFHKYHNILGNKTTMHPHYAVWYCPACAYNGYVSKDNVDCLSGGRYCHPDPDHKGPLTGKDTLYEDLRQICLFRDGKEGPENWWKYHNQFSKDCLNTPELEECSLDTIERAAGASVRKRVEKCVEESFEGNDPLLDNNKILEEERAIYLERGIVTWPSVVINNMTYRGNLQPAKLIFQAICEGFTVTPPECLEAEAAGPSYSDNTRPNASRGGEGVSFWIILLLIAFVCFTFAAIFIMYKRQMKREILKDMDYQISSTLHRYMAMKDEGESMVHSNRQEA